MCMQLGDEYFECLGPLEKAWFNKNMLNICTMCTHTHLSKLFLNNIT